jgi:hypothetical protein
MVRVALPGFGAVGKRTLTMDLPVALLKGAPDHGAVADEAVQRKAAGSPLASDPTFGARSSLRSAPT